MAHKIASKEKKPAFTPLTLQIGPDTGVVREFFFSGATLFL
jgi:hypothetical protein